jgi:EAL domain-containing protein (putative c-di-GMP-specific phosphodiesterase class I)
MVGPGEFIAVTEDVGLSGALGDWVFAEAAHWARRWRDEPGHEIPVSVNVSPTQFAVAGTAARWTRMLADLALAGSQIGIDVTETLLLDDSPVVADELRRVRAAGIAVAIDGFGTGRSAMSSLTKFDIGVIKIDRSLVRDLVTVPGQRALVEAIIVMAHKLGIRVVGEGIETPAQRDILRAAGCDFGQGFLLARPLPPGSVWARWSTLAM